jgi:uncharacterized UBP type Zn finger protein
MATDIYDTDMYNAALAALGIRSNGSEPRCDHVDGIRPVTPQSAECQDCRDSGTGWLGLLVCLTCGWVACSNDSPQRHAQAHYRETDHPIAGGLEPGSEWRWCYIHTRMV